MKCLANAPAAVPLQAGFEDSEGFTAGNLHGQRGWVVERGAAVIDGAEGSRYVRIEPTDPYGQIKLALDPVPVDAAVKVRFADFKVRPVAAASHEGAEFLDASGSVTGFLRVTSGGELLVLNGNGQNDGAWLGTGVKFPLSSPGGVAADWIRLTLRQDFASGTWDLFAGGQMVAAGLGFWNTPEQAAHAFVLVGNSVHPLHFDDLAVAYGNPLFEDADADGLPDPWERAKGTSTQANDRLSDPDGDGRTILDDYLSDTAASHPAMVPYLSWLSQPALYSTSVKEIDSDLSGLTWNAKSRTLYSVKNSGAGRVFELTPDGHVIREIRMSTIPGKEVLDPEGICWLGGERFAIAEERERRITLVTIGPERHSPRLYGSEDNRVVLFAGTAATATFAGDIASRDNSGLEGIAWDARTSTFLGVIQGDGNHENGTANMHVMRIGMDGRCDELFDATALLGSRILDLSDIAYDSAQRTLFLLSNRSRRLLVTDLGGRVIRDIALDSGSVPAFAGAAKPEGVAVLPGAGEIFLAGEPSVFARLRIPPAAEGQGEPVITEFLTKNDTGMLDDGGKRRDWIEITNPGSGAVNLENWSLTDDRTNLRKWIFPLRVILPGESLVVFASDKNLTPSGFGSLHTSFKLESGSGFLALVRPDGTVRQEFDYPEQAADISYGLSGVDGSTAGYFANPTPGTGNAEVTSLLEARGRTATTPEFSLQDAFLSSPSVLSLGPEIPGTFICYTTDGTEPYPSNPSAKIYTEPLNLTSSATVRAARSGAGYRPSDSVCRTYIFPADVVNQVRPPHLPLETDNSRFTFGATGIYSLDYDMSVPEGGQALVIQGLTAAPSVSITADPEDLFWIREGIYANSSRNGGEWNRRVSFEFIERLPDGSTRRYQANCEGSILGHSSRYASVTPKHSVRVRFKGKYGPPRLEAADLFASGSASVFEQLEIRNPAHDSWSIGSPWSANRNSARYVTDAFASGFIGSLGYPTFERRFVHLYLNGLYWGVYELIQPVDDLMVNGTFPENADSAGSGSSKADVLGAADDSNGGMISGDDARWVDVRAAALQLYQAARAGLPQDNSWDTISSAVHLQSLVDYVLANLWMNNLDWPAHNYLMARRRAASGKFYFISWDAEFSFRKDRPVNESTIGRMIMATDGPGWLFLKLCHHSDFRALVRARLDVLTGESGAFQPAAAWPYYESLASGFSPLLEAESARWGDAWADSPLGRAEWEENLTALREQFLPQRITPLRQQVLAELTGVESMHAQWAATRTSTPVISGGGNSGSGSGSGPGGGAEGAVVEAAPSDIDRDGLPDAWETAHGFNPEDDSDGLLDSDGDGLTNLEEYLAGTDPRDPASNRPETASPTVDLFTSLQPHSSPE